MKVELNEVEASYLHPIVWNMYTRAKSWEQLYIDRADPPELIEVETERKEIFKSILLKIENAQTERVKNELNKQ